MTDAPLAELERRILKRKAKVLTVRRHVCRPPTCSGCVDTDERPRLLVRRMTPEEVVGRDVIGAVLFDVDSVSLPPVRN